MYAKFWATYFEIHCKCPNRSDLCCAVLSHFSHVQLFVILWTVACQAPLSVEFSRQEYWSGFPCPPSGDHLDPGIEPTSLMSPALADGFFTTSTPEKPEWEAIRHTAASEANPALPLWGHAGPVSPPHTQV